MPETPASSHLRPLERFSDRVEDYARYRPSYPAEVLRFIGTKARLAETSVVADVGSGTGIFTRLLLDTGATVFAVEPNDAMRNAAENEFRARANFRSLKGSAEDTGLEDRSVSLVVCAQAFHWFEPNGTRKEFRRILARDGWCAVIWNTAVSDGSNFAIGYERIKNDFGTDISCVRVRHEDLGTKEQFDSFFGAGNWSRQVFENFQTLDFEGLKGRVLSMSYAPKEGRPRHGAMIAALRDLFDSCQERGLVRIDYKTRVFLGQMDFQSEPAIGNDAAQ